MSTLFGSLARLALAPSLDEVGFERRGFPVTPSATTRRLELVPQSVVCGFEWAVEGAGPAEVARRIELVDPEFRGFAYEGATMAYTIRDSVHGTATAQLLSGPGERHVFLAYIGIGFAMARLPRPLWRKLVPDLDSRYHPTMSWLAVDGYGFDLAYFGTRRWVEQQRVPKPYPWQGAPDYFPRAVDQGIGRALWFIHGGDASAAADGLTRFAPERHADLWSGLGLAATFAGGAAPGELTALRGRAGAHRVQLALGAVFAVKARSYAGFLPPHTEGALAALAGLSTADAVALADETEVVATAAGGEPPYEQWRQRIREQLALRADRRAA